MQEEIEEWKPVVGFEQYYHVSNLGKLKRIATGKGTYPGRLLRPSVDADGYLFSRLCDGRQKKLAKIHRIVAESFLGYCPSGMEVNHMDGIKANNCSSNLEYVTVWATTCDTQGEWDFGKARSSSQLTILLLSASSLRIASSGNLRKNTALARIR
jgi:hypothetical protein